MKSIKNKILNPFLILLIIIPILVILLFNIIMNIYIKKTAVNELKNTANGVEALIKREYLNSLKNEDIENILKEDKLSLVQDSLKISKLLANIEFTIIAKSGNVLLPKSFDNSFLDSNIVDSVYKKLVSSNDDYIVEVKIDGIRYYALKKSIKLSIKGSTILFIATTKNLDGVAKIINITLVIIFLIGIIISCFIAIRLANKIAKPILDLNIYSKQIGKGEFVAIPEDNSSKELNELTLNMNNMSLNLKDKELVQNMFLQNSSHELRTPLMSIQGYAEGIIAGIFSDNIKAAKIIQDQSKRLTALVDELLMLSKIENNSYKSEFIEYNLSDLIKEYIEGLQGYAMQQIKNINLKIDNEFIPIKVDESLLRQAFTNIASNSIKFSKNNVYINVSIKNSIAFIKISDDGDGISKEDMPHIFERFYKGKNGNFGLGLSIAKSALKYIAADVKVYNDNGAVFEISIKALNCN